MANLPDLATNEHKQTFMNHVAVCCWLSHLHKEGIDVPTCKLLWFINCLRCIRSIYFWGVDEPEGTTKIKQLKNHELNQSRR